MTLKECMKFCDNKGKEYEVKNNKIVFDYGYDEEIYNLKTGEYYHVTEEIYDFGDDIQKFKHDDNWVSEYSDIAILRILGYERREIEEILNIKI